MNDWSELKRLAEDARDGSENWLASEMLKGLFQKSVTPELVLALIAENERLAIQAEACQISARIHQGESADNWEEVKRLKAENEALRRVVSESASACGAAVSVECSLEFMQLLPGEIASVIKGLRKHQPSSEIVWCACGDGYSANTYGAGFMDANNGVCENCEAAMAKEARS